MKMKKDRIKFYLDRVKASKDFKFTKQDLSILYTRYCLNRGKIKREKEEKDWSLIEEQTNNVKRLFPQIKVESLPYYWAHNIKRQIEKIKKKDSDCMILCYANEGTGKSTLGFITCCMADPTFDFTRVLFDTEQFFNYVQELQITLQAETQKPTLGEAIREIELNKKKYLYLRGQAILLDEGVSTLFTRNAMKGENKDIVEFFTIMRLLGMFIFVNAVSFAMMEKDIRTRRAKISLYMEKRGEFRVYSRKKQKYIYYDDASKNVKFPQSQLTDYFPKLSGSEWANYQGKKADFIAKKTNNIIAKALPKEKKIRTTKKK